MCVASRPFGAGPVTLVIQPGVDITGDTAFFFLLMPQSQGSQHGQGRAVITVQPTGTRLTVDYVSAPVKAGQLAYKFYTDGTAVTEIEKATAIIFSAGGRQFALATGRMHSVKAALTACSESLLRSWGIDPSARAAPIDNAVTWFGPDEYPAEAVRRNAQGRAVASVTVSPAGKPITCRIVVSAKNDALDAATCRTIMKRARFEQTTDAKVRYTVLAVHWLLPGNL